MSYKKSLKVEVLQQVKDALLYFYIPKKLISYKVTLFRSNNTYSIESILILFKDKLLQFLSSATDEDSKSRSLADECESALNILSNHPRKIIEAINSVIAINMGRHGILLNLGYPQYG